MGDGHKKISFDKKKEKRKSNPNTNEIEIRDDDDDDCACIYFIGWKNCPGVLPGDDPNSEHKRKWRLIYLSEIAPKSCWQNVCSFCVSKLLLNYLPKVLRVLVAEYRSLCEGDFRTDFCFYCSPIFRESIQKQFTRFPTPSSLWKKDKNNHLSFTGRLSACAIANYSSTVTPPKRKSPESKKRSKKSKNIQQEHRIPLVVHFRAQLCDYGPRTCHSRAVCDFYSCRHKCTECNEIVSTPTESELCDDCQGKMGLGEELEEELEDLKKEKLFRLLGLV